MAASIDVDAVAGRPPAIKALNATVVLTNDNDAGVVSWAWTLVDAPPGATAALSAPAANTTNLGPLDVAGSYHVRLAVNGASGAWNVDANVDEIVIRVRTVGNLIIPAPGETTQAGADGWADWDTGMNETLQQLAISRTLQATYDASSPPQILIAPAAGPILLTRAVASLGNVLVIRDDGPSNRVVFDNKGRVIVTAALGAGETALDVNAPTTGTYVANFRNSTTAAVMFRIARDGTLEAVSSAAADYGYDFDAQGAVTGIVRFQNSTAVGAPFLVIEEDGTVSSHSRGAVHGMDVDADAATTNIARFRNATRASVVFRILTDGAIVHTVDTASANIAYDLNAPGSTATHLFRVRDTTSGALFSVTPSGILALTAIPAGGQRTVDINTTHNNAAGILRIWDGANALLSISPQGAVVLTPDAFQVPLGSADFFTLDLNHDVPAGSTLRGFVVDARNAKVDGGEALELYSAVFDGYTPGGTARGLHVSSIATGVNESVEGIRVRKVINNASGAVRTLGGRFFEALLESNETGVGATENDLTVNLLRLLMTLDGGTHRVEGNVIDLDLRGIVRTGQTFRFGRFQANNMSAAAPGDGLVGMEVDFDGVAAGGAVDSYISRALDASTVNHFRMVTPAGATRFGFRGDGRFEHQGSYIIRRVSVNNAASPYTVLSSDYFIDVDCSGGVVTINLEALADATTGRVLIIKDSTGNAAANNITIEGNAAETVDGALNKVLNVNYASVVLIATSAGWLIV